MRRRAISKARGDEFRMNFCLKRAKTRIIHRSAWNKNSPKFDAPNHAELGRFSSSLYSEPLTISSTRTTYATADTSPVAVCCGTMSVSEASANNSRSL
jgi:hypothetical protein